MSLDSNKIYVLSNLSNFGFTTRVPGHPVRDCTRGYNNCAHVCAQLSAIDVTGKTLIERLY